jgi:hypothetical protein
MAQDDAGPASQAPEPQLCPLCTALATLRQTRPEAVGHLVKAGAELFLAARALLDGAAAPTAGPASRRRPRPAGTADAMGNGLQRIDVG